MITAHVFKEWSEPFKTKQTCKVCMSIFFTCKYRSLFIVLRLKLIFMWVTAGVIPVATKGLKDVKIFHYIIIM